MSSNPNTPLQRLFGDRTPATPAAALVKSAPPIAAPTISAEEEIARAELAAEATEPDFYRPYIARARPLLGFVIVEKNGTLHGFQYHTIRHAKHQHRQGKEYLTFSADGQVIGIEGRGLAPLFRALVRHTLYEMREYDQKPERDPETHITDIEIADPRDLANGAEATSAGQS